jgi:putative membrane protein
MVDISSCINASRTWNPTMSRAAPPLDSNQMAVDRTWLAHERTLMAWVRTATSMISFGFTIYKFFQFEVAKDAPVRRALLTPRDFALIMVSIGLVSLLAATVAHRREIKGMSTLLQGRRSLAEVIAYFVSGFGILVLLSTPLPPLSPAETAR